MGVKPPKPRLSLGPSSRYLDRLLLSLRNQRHLPTRIWPEESSSPATAVAGDCGDDDEDDDPPPPTAQPLKLSHPLLRALEASSSPFSPLFLQSLARLLVSGLARQPLAAARAIKPLAAHHRSFPLALALFAAVDAPDAFLLNTILRAFVSFRLPDQAFAFFCRHRHAVPPNHFTFPLLAKLFADLGFVREGRMTHTQIAKSGLEADVFIRNALIHMYSSFGDVATARRVFDLGFSFGSDLVTWNSMVDGYLKNKMVGAAQELFEEMPERDIVSWNAMIAGHARVGDMDAAKDLFSMMPKRDVVSWNAVINGYAKIGDVKAAREHFDTMPEKNLVSWNIMLALYARTKDCRECLKLFDGMMAVGDVEPNEATLVSVLMACATLGQLERGKWVHFLIKDSFRRIEADVLLQTALLTMYAKCGVMDSAKEIFDSMEERSVVSWNSMIIGYGLHGHTEKALEVFMEMENKGPRPNETTFVCILSACAHGGMVLEGWWCFDRMIRFYDIEPKEEHFGCMVDLLSRAGLLRDSEDLINSMPAEPSRALLGALSSACRTHCDWELGEIVGKKLIELDPRDVGPYVLLSNIYAARGRWDNVEKVREMMKENSLQKVAGVSLVGKSGCGSDPLKEVHVPVSKKAMVISMLSELGSHLKLSCRAFNERQTDGQY